jgi:ketosteroid isomerase-like protein
MPDEFQRLEDEWARIVQEQDVEAAQAFLADDFVLTSAGGVGPRMRKVEWIAGLPEIETRSIRCLEPEARIFGEVAVVRALLEWDASTRGGRDLNGRYHVTDVFTRADDGWHPSWRVSVRAGEPAA